MIQLSRRRFNSILASALTAASVGVTAFPAVASDKKKIVFLVNGNLGDKSYFDLAAAGMKAIKDKYGDGVDTKLIEMGTDQTKWLPTYEDISEQDWDVIAACTYDISDVIMQVAPNYPDKTYILIDGVIDYSKGKFENVYSVVYKENEGSYLAGILAAGLIADGTIPPSMGKLLGFLGGMDIPVINNFLTGYVEGARSVTPDIKIAVSYAGSFNDAAKGKELALAQYQVGTAIGFNVAGLTGLGQLAAAKDAKKYAIGVNSDQELIFRDTDPDMASHIVSSMLKNVDVTLLRAFELFVDGKLAIGKVESIGLAEGAVGLAENGNMARIASPELKKQIDQAKADIIAGKIKVSSAYSMEASAVAAMRDSVRP